MNQSLKCLPCRLASLALLSAILVPALSQGDDWPEWRGRGRRGVWKEDGILERFPETGLAYTWRSPIHEGYSGPAVSRGRVFVMDFIRDRGIRGTERALALDEATGELLWKQEWPVDYGGTEPVWANGPRATPTVDTDQVYFMGGMGHLLCVDIKNGSIIWHHDLVVDYDAVV